MEASCSGVMKWVSHSVFVMSDASNVAFVLRNISKCKFSLSLLAIPQNDNKKVEQYGIPFLLQPARYFSCQQIMLFSTLFSR